VCGTNTDLVHRRPKARIFSLKTHHYHGALRLRKRKADQSRVVKFGPEGTLVVGGRPLDYSSTESGALIQVSGLLFPGRFDEFECSSIGAGSPRQVESQRTYQ